MAVSSAGAKVVQVDASRGMTDWAKENMKLSHLENNEIRFIVDDCVKFVEREIRRGNKYDAIVMDPPSYGRGPNKEVWKFEKNIYYYNIYTPIIQGKSKQREQIICTYEPLWCCCKISEFVLSFHADRTNIERAE